MTQSIANDELELLTKEEVAKLGKWSGRQVVILVKDGRLPKPIKIGTHPRWRRSELLRFLDSLSERQPDTDVA